MKYLAEAVAAGGVLAVSVLLTALGVAPFFLTLTVASVPAFIYLNAIGKTSIAEGLAAAVFSAASFAGFAAIKHQVFQKECESMMPEAPLMDGVGTGFGFETIGDIPVCGSYREVLIFVLEKPLMNPEAWIISTAAGFTGVILVRVVRD